MKTLLAILIFATITAIPTTSFAQAKSFGVFDNHQQYYDFMVSVKEAAAQNPELKAMVPLVNDMVLNRPLGSTGRKFNVQDNQLGLLSDEKVRAELDMSEKQFEKISARFNQIQARAGRALSTMDFTDTKAVVIQVRQIREKAEKDLEDVLLPHQAERLTQLHNRSRLQHQSLGKLITSDPVRDQLKIDDEQAEEILDMEAKIEKELEEEIAELREKAREKFLSKLNSSQRKQVEEMLGDSFEFAKVKNAQKESSTRTKTPLPKRK